MDRERPSLEKADPDAPADAAVEPTASKVGPKVSVGAFRCPFCHSDVRPKRSDWVACKACLARHHEECWSEGGVCASCGGKEALRGDAKPRRKRPPLAIIFLVSFVCTGVLSVSTYVVSHRPPTPVKPHVDDDKAVVTVQVKPKPADGPKIFFPGAAPAPLSVRSPRHLLVLQATDTNIDFDLGEQTDAEFVDFLEKEQAEGARILNPSVPEIRATIRRVADAYRSIDDASNAERVERLLERFPDAK